MSRVAKALQQDRLKRGASIQAGSILTVVTDDHAVLCMTEPMLDTWWLNLSPQQKAELFEADLDGSPDEHLRQMTSVNVPAQSPANLASLLRNWELLQQQPISVLGKLVAL